MTNILGVIPARYASTRFPGKPLIDIDGKPMIQRVYEQAKQAKLLSDVIVATDDERIFNAVEQFGGKAMMTSASIPSGTERVATIAEKLDAYSYFINIQGDEPYVQPSQIDQVAQILKESEEVDMATLVKEIKDLEVLNDPKYVKVILGADGYAVYFSRAAIPYCRDLSNQSAWLKAYPYYKHISIYGFKRFVLLQIPHMPTVVSEQAESLEQLRWLGNGYRIKVGITTQETVSVDTPQDLRKLKEFKENQPGEK